jgi:hypothetical protein
VAKPRIFVSSTYYDLKHIRNNVESFISGFGYEAVLFESGDIAFDHAQPLDESCYVEIENCHMLVLIIGGRYGSVASVQADKSELDRAYKSITKKEYETARHKDIPIYIFVEKAVMAEYQTYKENKKNTDIVYAHVDSVAVFHLLDDILIQKRNNLVRDFEKFDDISSWLTDQWAGLFADFLSKKSSITTLNGLSTQVEELKELSGVLKTYNESIIRHLEPKKSEKIISDSEFKLKKHIAHRFSEEPLINFLCNKEEARRLTPFQLYEFFEESSDLTEFLANSKLLPPDVATRFIDDLGADAEADFQIYLHKYQLEANAILDKD